MSEKEKKKIMIWGAGEISKQIITKCPNLYNYDIVGIIDNDHCKVGGYHLGWKIFSPNILNEIIVDVIVIMTNYYEEVREQISKEYPYYLDKTDNRYFFFKECILKRYECSTDIQIVNILKYITKKGLGVFNYSFAEKYCYLNYEVTYDEKYNCYFYMYNNRKMYISKRFSTKEDAQKYIASIMVEQDEESPHKYLTKEFGVEKDDVVVDVGAAEGFFALDVIDVASKVYIVEADKDWVEALKITFKNELEKVEIIEKYVTSYDDGKYATLDGLIKEKVDFIKMDIEGYEWDALQGCKEIICRSPKCKLAICAYHDDVDQDLIEAFFDRYGVSHSATEGYMWFPGMGRQNYVSTRLCKGVIRGEKNVGSDSSGCYTGVQEKIKAQ